MSNETVAGIVYERPKVATLQQSKLLVAEYAGRVAYDSFSNSEHQSIRDKDLENLDAESSELLTSLVWVHLHHSVLEHLSVTYLIEGISRGVLQELVRHRLASPTVRSTRYTMQDILNIFIAAELSNNYQFLHEKLTALNMFTVKGTMEELEIYQLSQKLKLHMDTIGRIEFYSLALSKEAFSKVPDLPPDAEEIYKILSACKKKRNVGDAFKYLVTDNWKTDLVLTINLRSLKNLLDLRDSGAAFVQIQWLAQEIKKATPQKFLKLIVKDK